MKKQFLHEAHNLQDKAKKPDYRDRIKEEGDEFNRGGESQASVLSTRGSTVYVDLRPSFDADKRSLLETLERQMKFIVDGEVGTIPRLMKNPKLAERVKKRYEMTRRSVLRAPELAEIARHPKKNRQFRVVEFTCFLQPLEAFPNPIFKRLLAFRLKVAQQRP